MRFRLAFALFLVGFSLFAGTMVIRFRHDRDRLAQELTERHGAVVQGWRSDWRAHLAARARDDALPQTYTLTFDRSGTALKSPFVPARGVERDWGAFRAARDGGRRAEVETFLREALAPAYAGSWDRVLAIEAWSALGLGDLPDVALTPYEQTLVDPEAKAAYEALFHQFGTAKSFVLAATTFELDETFFRVLPTGDIQAFLPSTRALAATELPRFLAAERASAARLGTLPWDIHFAADGAAVDDGDAPARPFTAGSPAKWEWLMALGSLAAIVSGGALLLGATRAEKRRLQRRVGFLNQVVHELKTPLTGLKLHVDLLDRHGVTVASLAAVRESARRLDRLFTEISVLNRASDRPGAKTAPRAYLAAAEAAAVVAELRAEFPACDFSRALPTAGVATSRAALAIILRNLVGNALSYGHDVRVEWEADGRGAFLVKDKGPGVSRAAARRIFQEFYRAPAARDARPGGLGLGLAVARRLAADTGARLSLENPGEPGAVFRLSLELAPGRGSRAEESFYSGERAADVQNPPH